LLKPDESQWVRVKRASGSGLTIYGVAIHPAFPG
jgi:hypothetical protein